MLFDQPDTGDIILNLGSVHGTFLQLRAPCERTCGKLQLEDFDPHALLVKLKGKGKKRGLSLLQKMPLTGL